jgi:hypothetical protein
MMLTPVCDGYHHGAIPWRLGRGPHLKTTQGNKTQIVINPRSTLRPSQGKRYWNHGAGTGSTEDRTSGYPNEAFCQPLHYQRKVKGCRSGVENAVV